MPSYSEIVETGPAIGILPIRQSKHKPITVIGTPTIRETFDDATLQQAINSSLAPGVTNLILNPDAHLGYGAPVGSVLISPTHIYPGPVGVDIKCSMSFLQLKLPADELSSREVRRALMKAILERIPTGVGRGQSNAPKARRVSTRIGVQAVTLGATEDVCDILGIPSHWIYRCEDNVHTGHLDSDGLKDRLAYLISNGIIRDIDNKISQLGSYGGGNHFGECEVVNVLDNERARSTAKIFGLQDRNIGFLSHCGSRGLGHTLAQNQFKLLQNHFVRWDIPFPGGDKQLVYTPLGTKEADNYLDDMAIGANFATINHLLINALVLEAFQEIFPGVEGELVYFISHNIARQEICPRTNHKVWVHRKGATRAVPAGHFSLMNTPFYLTGHPILLPGNPQAGSAIMVADEGSALTHHSINHGAGRCMGRKQAKLQLQQDTIDADLIAADILHNSRKYPIDESPAAYKNFNEVLRSVKLANLATEVARLQAKFVIKDGDSPADD